MKQKLVVFILCVFLTGCAMNPKPVVGSANQFDSDSYLTLVTADALIQATKTDLANGSFSATLTASVTQSLNALITAYDIANPVYIAYHNAALAGTATTAQQATVTNSLSNVKVSVTALTTVKGGK